jgi:hypothetical protein
MLERAMGTGLDLRPSTLLTVFDSLMSAMEWLLTALSCPIDDLLCLHGCKHPVMTGRGRSVSSFSSARYLILFQFTIFFAFLVSCHAHVMTLPQTTRLMRPDECHVVGVLYSVYQRLALCFSLADDIITFLRVYSLLFFYLLFRSEICTPESGLSDGVQALTLQSRYSPS